MYPYMLQRKLLVLVDGFPYSHKVATLECNSLYILLYFVCYYYGMISTRSALLIVFTCLDESILNIALVIELCLSRMLLCVGVNYPLEDSYNTVYYDVCVHR